MKAFKMIGLALMGTLTGASFSACTSEIEEVLGQDTEIRLISEITPSRVTSLDYQSTQIVANQQVGITITGAKADHKNVAWTAEADGALTNTGSTLYYGTGTATITAYHPHNSAWTGTSHTFSVNTDQSTDAGYLGSDLLWANASSNKTANAVPLTFTHKLAKINVTLVPEEEGTNLSGATISICGTNIATNFNPSTGVLSAATANVQEIKAGVTTTTDKTASAIIVPQTVAASTPFIKVTLGEKIFYHKLSAEKTFASGKSYSYTLTVKEKKVEVDTEGDINDWENGDEGNTGDANEVDLSWFNPNQYITYVRNEHTYFSGKDDDNTHNHTSNISFPVSKIIKMELKYQMKGNSTLEQACYLFCNNSSKTANDALVINNDGIVFTDGNNNYSYSWNQLNVEPTDCMVFTTSFKDGNIKINETTIASNIPTDIEFTPSYLFSRYEYEHDSGWWCLKGYGVPEGSKLYYAKIWDENDKLIYLGAASKALNPTTNEEEYCWRSYYEGEDSYQFAYYAEELDDNIAYAPYGGGTD